MMETPTDFLSSNDPKATARVKMEMEEVWTFERKLILGDDQENDSDSESYRENDDEDEDKYYTTIKDFQKRYPYLNWLDYINAILPAELNVTENEPLVNWDPVFFKKLEGIFKTTSNRTLANYIVWRAIYSIYQMEQDETDTTGWCEIRTFFFKSF